MTLPHGYWTSIKNRRLFLDSLARTLNLKTWESWYDIDSKQIVAHGGQTLLLKYNGSLSNALKTLYPEHEWKIWRFLQISRNFWKLESNQKLFMDDFFKKKEWTQYEDWYQLKKDDISSYGGSGLLILFKNSLLNLLRTVYPYYEWLPWKFRPVDSGFWIDRNNQLYFMRKLGDHLGYDSQNWRDWYQLKTPDLVEFGGSGLLNHHGGSIWRLLNFLYPEFPWKEWDAKKVREEHWISSENQRDFMEVLGQKLGIVRWEDWYRVDKVDIRKSGGAGLLKSSGDSLYTLMQKVYPEHPWRAYLFDTVPSDYWSNINHVREFFEDIGKLMGIRGLDDWYNVKHHDISKYGGRGMLQHYGNSVRKAICVAYPHYPWKSESAWRWSYKVRKSQMQLFRLVSELFIHENVHMEMDLNQLVPHDPPPERFRADVVVPSKGLIFEYQGEQHYHKMKIFSGFEEQQKRDIVKKAWSEKSGLTLVEIPYWWNGSKDSLVATIVKLRPDLAKSLEVAIGVDPIPEKDPGSHAKRSRSEISKSLPRN